MSGEDNRYSNSKCQMPLWFGVLAVTYLSGTFLRWAVSDSSPDFAAGIDLPESLLLLSGLSVFSFGAAKGITSNREAAVATPPPALSTAAPAGPPPPALKVPACTEVSGRPDAR